MDGVGGWVACEESVEVVAREWEHVPVTDREEDAGAVVTARQGAAELR